MAAVMLPASCWLPPAARSDAPRKAAGPGRLWSPAEVGGRNAYQRNDLIDPMRTNARGETSRSLMQRGRAPIGPDDKPPSAAPSDAAGNRARLPRSRSRSTAPTVGCCMSTRAARSRRESIEGRSIDTSPATGRSGLGASGRCSSVLGAGGVGGEEIYGPINDDVEDARPPQAIGLTRRDGQVSRRERADVG